MFSFLPTFPSWLILDANPLESLLQGFVGACGISVFCNLTRVNIFLEGESSSNGGSNKDTSNQTKQNPHLKSKAGLSGKLQFWFLTVLLSVVGSRVSSLVVLEFTLRAVSAWGGSTKTDPGRPGFLKLLLVQCQFSLGCALSCSLHFLHEGASQRWLCLLLIAALSWFLATQSARLLQHVVALYRLHSSQRYCGLCITLLSSGRSLLPRLLRALTLTFAVAGIAGISIINKHFLSATDALKFWTPLTICYTLLVVYMQENDQRHPSGQTVLNTVVVRLGGLMVLMLTVGRWVDMLHILMCFLGEAACLMHSNDLFDAAFELDEWEVDSDRGSSLRKQQPPEKKQQLTTRKNSAVTVLS